jgi:hypothetical protein
LPRQGGLAGEGWPQCQPSRAAAIEAACMPLDQTLARTRPGRVRDRCSKGGLSRIYCSQLFLSGRRGADDSKCRHDGDVARSKPHTTASACRAWKLLAAQSPAVLKRQIVRFRADATTTHGPWAGTIASVKPRRDRHLVRAVACAQCVLLSLSLWLSLSL